jgi:hypothetical protein
MENTPEAAGAAPAVQPEATPNTTPEQTAPAAPDMHGFTSDELAEMRKFYDSRGGFNKVKSMLSNPQPKVEQNVLNTPAPTVEERQFNNPFEYRQEQPAYHAPEGSITRDEFDALRYAEHLAHDPKYAAISGDIESGQFLRDMADLNIRLVNQDGSFNDRQVRKYLDLKAQTVAAKQTSSAPEAGAAPTVDYAPYDANTMDMKQAMAILQQDSALRGRGMGGHPNAAQAEEFMKKALNPQK